MVDSAVIELIKDVGFPIVVALILLVDFRKILTEMRADQKEILVILHNRYGKKKE